MLPPPNVTGSLHMGHALDHTIQDVLVRFHRMRGHDVLWQPGTDHAGIATQMVVERQLAASGSNQGRRELGREAFVAKVWEWKAQSGGTIVRQMRRLGASPDWSRERFTMDEGLSRPCSQAFVALHKPGLIYRDKRLVNWDVQLQTAISDLEVEQPEVDGHLWHLRYPIEGGDGRVHHGRHHPARDHAGRHRRRGASRRRALPPPARPPRRSCRSSAAASRSSPTSIPTPRRAPARSRSRPAHDFNDFEVGRRHALEAIAILDELGRVNDNAPEAYRGLDRFEARKRVVAELEALGLLERVEKHRHTVPHGDRSGTPLEPFLTDQWYCDAKTLAQAAIDAVEDGRTRFVPRAVGEHLLRVDAQHPALVHLAPALVGPPDPGLVRPGRAGVRRGERGRGRGRRRARTTAATSPLRRDEDVLDTWFSSGLWPFSTLGWPEQTPELARFYPTTVLVTGFDIIFFWVARMMMLGLHFMGEVPFKDVFIHGLVRDERGTKMSKTKGNVIDPLQLIDDYGADALRFALLATTAQGRDIKFGPARVEGYRNFVTKLWNAARFVQMNEARARRRLRPAQPAAQPLNRWIVGETAKTAAAVTAALEAYRFNDAALGLYHFIWDTFCDWYVELAKPLLTGEDAAAAGRDPRHRRLGAGAGPAPAAPDRALRHRGAVAAAVRPPGRHADRRRLAASSAASWSTPQAEAELGWLVRTIGAIRAARSELNVPPGARLTLHQHGAAPDDSRLAGAARRGHPRLARARRDRPRRAADRRRSRCWWWSTRRPSPCRSATSSTSPPSAPRLEQGDRQARRPRSTAAEQKLANADFVARAPAEVVEQQRERLSRGRGDARAPAARRCARIG